MNDHQRRLFDLIAGLAAQYPSAIVPADTAKGYVARLERYPFALIEAAVVRAVDTNPTGFLPSIGAIKLQAAKLYLTLPSASVAEEMVAAAVATSTTRQLPEAVRSALELVGGSYAWRNEKASVIRAQFAERYAQKKEAMIEAFAAGEMEIGAWPRESPQLIERVESESEVLPELTEEQRQENIERANELARRIGARPIPTE